MENFASLMIMDYEAYRILAEENKRMAVKIVEMEYQAKINQLQAVAAEIIGSTRSYESKYFKLVDAIQEMNEHD